MMMYRVLYFMALMLSLVACVCVADSELQENSALRPPGAPHPNNCPPDTQVTEVGVCPPDLVAAPTYCKPGTKPVEGGEACLSDPLNRSGPHSLAGHPGDRGEAGGALARGGGVLQAEDVGLQMEGRSVGTEDSVPENMKHSLEEKPCLTVDDATGKDLCKAESQAGQLSPGKNEVRGTEASKPALQQPTSQGSNHSSLAGSLGPSALPQEGLKGKPELKSKVEGAPLPNPDENAKKDERMEGTKVSSHSNNHVTSGTHDTAKSTETETDTQSEHIEESSVAGPQGGLHTQSILSSNTHATQTHSGPSTSESSTSTSASQNVGEAGTGTAGNNATGAESDSTSKPRDMGNEDKTTNTSVATNSETPNTPSNEESTTTTTTLPPVSANINKKPNVKGDADSSVSMSSVWVRVTLLIVIALACILV